MWTMLRTVTLLNVRRESGCVLAPHVVTQWVPADASAGAIAAATKAAAAQRETFIVVPPGYGDVVDRVKTSVFVYEPVRSASVAAIGWVKVMTAVPLDTGPSHVFGAIATCSGCGSAK